MTKLESLRSRITDLRRRRSAVRHGAGYAALALAVICILVAAFLIDWTFSLSRLQRVLLLLVAAVATALAYRKYALPWFQTKESDLDIALMVERKQKIDSDLVAALQFESPEAAQWGSTQLEGAVIDYVADFSKGWNIFEGFSKQELTKRAVWLVLSLALVAMAVGLRLDFAKAFLNRMLLGSAHYPTRTQIEGLAINGKPVDLLQGDAVVVKFPYGQPLKFDVKGAGDLPAMGKVEFTSASGGTGATVELRSDKNDTASTFKGELPKLVDSVYSEIRLGDAWTDPLLVQMVALPVVDTKLTPIPPPYARGVDDEDAVAPGSRQLAVIEGSTVDLAVMCANKRLASATLKIDDKSFALEESASAGPEDHVWKLPAENSPLRRVTKPLRYEVHVVDEDGLSPELAVSGSIRIKADNRPRISGDVVTRFVVPTGSPKIEYRASDDYGIKELSVLLETLRGEKTATERVAVATRLLREVPAGTWIGREQMPVAESFPLDLKSLSLQKGDQLRITLQVVDYRGDGEGQMAASEPIVLQVTDESGILAAISESDERSARQLDAIIERQLGVGESK